jgi:hypothetical protein
MIQDKGNIIHRRPALVQRYRSPRMTKRIERNVGEKYTAFIHVLMKASDGHPVIQRRMFAIICYHI